MSAQKIIVERPDKKIYLEDGKVYKLMGGSFSAPDVLNEALNLAAVGQTELKVPKFHEVRQINGSWAIVMDHVEGDTLADLMAKDPGGLDAHLNRFVDIQLEMHKHTASWLPVLLEKTQRKIKASGLDATTRYELHTRLDSLPRHTKLCHGDFHPSNIIITAGGDAYIIDWSHATQGNASADAALTWLLFRLEGKTDTADKYLDLFCEKSDTAKQYVQKWIAIVSASRLAKAKPEQKDFLLQWTNIAEYH
jgi:aminoglycoside phosphotransferase (APT) family kinase protein